jgi:hypothetical protein
MKPGSYPWYEEVSSSEPIDQGAIIENCHVYDWLKTLPLRPEDKEGPLDDYFQLRKSDCIVMTQTCDLVQNKVSCVTLCTVRSLNQFKQDYERLHEAPLNHGKWEGMKKELKDGRWNNFGMLNPYEPEPTAKMSRQEARLVSFEVIYTLPCEALQIWAQTSTKTRLQLLPPYREELSQAFARYFMRVGLPIDRTYQ